MENVLEHAKHLKVENHFSLKDKTMQVNAVYLLKNFFVNRTKSTLVKQSNSNLGCTGLKIRMPIELCLCNHGKLVNFSSIKHA